MAPWGRYKTDIPIPKGRSGEEKRGNRYQLSPSIKHSAWRIIHFFSVLQLLGPLLWQSPHHSSAGLPHCSSLALLQAHPCHGSSRMGSCTLGARNPENLHGIIHDHWAYVYLQRSHPMDSAKVCCLHLPVGWTPWPVLHGSLIELHFGCIEAWPRAWETAHEVLLQ